MLHQEFDARSHGVLLVLCQLLPPQPKLVRVLDLPRHDPGVSPLRNLLKRAGPAVVFGQLGPPRPRRPARALPGVSSTGVGISHSDPDLAALQETANAGRAEITRAIARTVATTNGRAGSREVGRELCEGMMAYFASRAFAVHAPGLRNTLG